MESTINPLQIPAAYRTGYRESLAVDVDTAYNYVAHTQEGDPVMDAIVEDLASLPQRRIHEFIQAGMEKDPEGLKDAPPSLRSFFLDAPPPYPEWLDHDAFAPGIRAFQRNAVRILSAFVTGVLIDGFSTLISKSFVHTGRIFDNGVRRLRQNNRHQMEIFFPGACSGTATGGNCRSTSGSYTPRFGGCWRVLRNGTRTPGAFRSVRPHMGYAMAVFAARTVKHSISLGARYSTEERASFHQVWRYSGYLMGIHLPRPSFSPNENHAW